MDTAETLQGYQISLSIRHPSMAPDAITAQLHMIPQYKWKRGERRKTPRGTVLPGVRNETRWRHVRPFVQGRLFFDGVKAMLTTLEPNADFLSKVASEGGQVTILVNLPGYVNIGDVLDAATLKRLADLQVALSVEVFPTIQRGWPGFRD